MRRTLILLYVAVALAIAYVCLFEPTDRWWLIGVVALPAFAVAGVIAEVIVNRRSEHHPTPLD